MLDVDNDHLQMAGQTSQNTLSLIDIYVFNNILYSSKYMVLSHFQKVQWILLLISSREKLKTFEPSTLAQYEEVSALAGMSILTFKYHVSCIDGKI